MHTMLHNVTANTDSFMFLMIFGVLGLVGLVAMLMATIWKISSNRQLERSRREIAAHIAGGSMSPADGARLLNAGADRDKRSKPEGMTDVGGDGSGRHHDGRTMRDIRDDEAEHFPALSGRGSAVCAQRLGRHDRNGSVMT